jgi:heme-degrading monooxygenase HmoA
MSDLADESVTIMIRFDVLGDNQAALVEVMSASLRDVLSRQPGYIEGAILPSDDGTHVIHESRWRHLDDIDAARRDSGAQHMAMQMSDLGATPHPVVYKTRIPFPRANA